MRTVTLTRAVTDSGGHTTNVQTTLTINSASATEALVAVRVFPTYTTKTYGDYTAVLAKLTTLGIKRISHLLTPSMSLGVQKFTTDAAALGIKSWFSVGTPGVALTTAQWTKIEQLLTGPLAGCVTMVSGWNEPNTLSGWNEPLASWVTPTGVHQRALYPCIQRVNATNAAAGIAPIVVGTPQLWSGDIDQQWADLTAMTPGIAGCYDVISWHLYPRGGPPTWMIAEQEAHFKTALGDKPIVCTEGGYFTAPNYTGGSNPVTEADQALYLPQLIDEYVSRGWGVSLFELLDDPDPTGAEREASFGIVRTPSLDSSTWTNKPAFDTVKAALA